MRSTIGQDRSGHHRFVCGTVCTAGDRMCSTGQAPSPSWARRQGNPSSRKQLACGGAKDRHHEADVAQGHRGRCAGTSPGGACLSSSVACQTADASRGAPGGWPKHGGLYRALSPAHNPSASSRASHGIHPCEHVACHKPHSTTPHRKKHARPTSLVEEAEQGGQGAGVQVWRPGAQQRRVAPAPRPPQQPPLRPVRHLQGAGRGRWGQWQMQTRLRQALRCCTARHAARCCGT